MRELRLAAALATPLGMVSGLNIGGKGVVVVEVVVVTVDCVVTVGVANF